MVSGQFHLDKWFAWGWWTVHSQSFCSFLFDTFLGAGTARVSFDEREVGTYWWSCVCPLVSIPCMSEARERNALNLACTACGSGGGALPYISHIGMCRPKGLDFCAVLVWKRVQILPILVWNRVWRNYGCVSMGSLFQFQMDKKERAVWEFEMDFKKFFCGSFNLSNDDTISVLRKHVMLPFFDHLQAWKLGWKMTFFGLKWGQDWESRAAYPHQEFPRVPPPGLAGCLASA